MALHPFLPAEEQAGIRTRGRLREEMARQLRVLLQAITHARSPMPTAVLRPPASASQNHRQFHYRCHLLTQDAR